MKKGEKVPYSSPIKLPGLREEKVFKNEEERTSVEADHVAHSTWGGLNWGVEKCFPSCGS